MIGRRLRRLVPAPVARADLAVFRWVARQHAPVLDATLPRLSTAANHSRLWMGTALVLALGGGRFGRRAALRGMLAVGLTSAIANLPAKLLTNRKRPDLAVVPEVRRLAKLPTSTSFPSGHSASAAAFATAVGLEMPRARWPLGAVASAVALSRVYTGVHYPGDVLAGVALGGAVALGTRRRWPLADHTVARGERVEGVGRPTPDGDGLVIVANSQAGPALLPGPAEKLRRELPGAKVIEVTDPDGLAGALAEACRVARVLGIAGGDGSVSAAAVAASEAGLPLLVVPAGTLNHLATDLGLATITDVVAAVRDGEVVRADLAEIDGRPFVNAASIGVYPHLVDAREEREARLGKWPALLYGLARILPGASPAEVDLDGERHRLWLLFAGNSRYTATGIAPSRRRRLDDGLIDLRILHAGQRGSLARILASVATGRLGRSAPYEQRLVREVRIRSASGPLRLACDGETFQGSGEFTIRKRDQALLLLVPSTGSGHRA